MAISKIITSSLTDDAVTAAKIPAGAVAADIGTGGIVTANIADDAVTGDKIENSPTIAGNLAVAGTSTLTGALSVDTISEKTSANGVSVDGLKLKDYSLIYGSNTAITITPQGYVTKPNLPSFVAHSNTAGSGYQSTSGVFPANATNHNLGNHFNTGSSGSSNYAFTAPVDGVYLFTFSSIHSSSGQSSRPMFHVNGAETFNGVKHGINGQDAEGAKSNVSISLIKLSANDYVQVKSQSGNLYYYDAAHSTFSGCLIG